MKLKAIGVRPSHRRLSIVGTVVAGGAIAACLAPAAASASIGTNYPPTDSCASTVLPSGVSLGQSSSGATATSTACSGIQPTSAGRSSASKAPAYKAPAANTGNSSDTKSSSGLAFTGSDVPILAGLGTLMVVGGVMIVVQSRRRQV